ncbi:MAG: hypothetical protein A2Y66_01895 [Nitrospirae bacterium RBG_13_41_22]|nr:MAG: hypothetical protein A2Y66_01895 [Nitrospirae bacterium RBG_13_41_22]
MGKYQIKYKGHLAVSKGMDARDAFENYCNRTFFGYNPIVAWDTQFELIDADTYGHEWASYYNDEMGRISVELI